MEFLAKIWPGGDDPNLNPRNVERATEKKADEQAVDQDIEADVELTPEQAQRVEEAKASGASLTDRLKSLEQSPFDTPADGPADEKEAA